MSKGNKKPRNCQTVRGYNSNQWRWRDLNPRPNVELICFLHAYSLLVFRSVTGKRQPIAPLSSKISETPQGEVNPIPDLPAPPVRLVSGLRQSGDVLSLQLLRRLSQVYYTSTRQQERKNFRHLKNLMSQIRERSHHCSSCLHTTSTRCQNRSSPIIPLRKVNAKVVI